MKKGFQLFLLGIFLLCSEFNFAQPPSMFNYQAVLRSSSEGLIANTDVIIQFEIINGETSATAYAETHETTTSDLGLINLHVGEGSNTIGSFTEINWESGNYYLKTLFSLDEGENFTELGQTRLVAVPYAMYAQNANKAVVAESIEGNSWSEESGNLYYNNGKVGIGTNQPVSNLEIKGSTFNNDSDPLFAVVNNTGDTVFAVFQSGVRIYVDDNPTKATGNKGGFAVGGFNSGKGITHEFLRVTPDSTRIYIKESTGKTRKGGFAISGLSENKTSAQSYMLLTPENYFIGHEAGKSNTTGLYNSFIGYKAGFSNTVGNRNTFLGYYAGYSNVEGNINIFMGDSSGYYNETGFYNVFIGNNAGTGNISGYSNVFLGNRSGSNNIDGKWNVFVGHKTGHHNTSGTGNVFIGATTGYYNTTGLNNVFVGDWAGNFNTVGSDNLFFGRQAGWNNVDGNTNIFLGSFAGFNNVSGYDNIFFGNNAGYNSLNSYSNIFIGNKSGYSNANGIKNIFFGFESGYSNETGNSNIFIGNNAGYANISGYKNTFIGDSAGYSSINGRYNVFIGDRVGYANTSGLANVMIGSTTGENNTTGSGNTFVGNWSGFYNTTGSQNLYLGSRAGWNNIEGSGNVFIGYKAGFKENGSNKLYIENSEVGSDTALIYGEFDNNILRFNANIGIGGAPIHYAALFVQDTLDAATTLIKGVSDGFNYANLILESNESIRKFWQLSHHASNNYKVVYYEDGDYKNRFEVNAYGGAHVYGGDFVVDSAVVSGQLKSNGGIAANLSSVSSDYSINKNDYTLLVATSDTDITLNLPQASTVANQVFIIKKTDGNAFNVIVEPYATELIDSGANYSLSNQNQAITVQSDGVNWHVIGIVN